MPVGGGPVIGPLFADNIWHHGFISGQVWCRSPRYSAKVTSYYLNVSPSDVFHFRECHHFWMFI